MVVRAPCVRDKETCGAILVSHSPNTGHAKKKGEVAEVFVLAGEHTIEVEVEERAADGSWQTIFALPARAVRLSVSLSPSLSDSY